MLSHPMFDRNGVPAAAHPGYADALLNSRYAAAAGGAGRMDPLLLQQEMRRQDMLASSGGFAAAAHPHDNNAALLARREEELVRLHDAHNRIMEAELAARAMRDRVAAAQSQAAQAQDESFRADSIERIVALQEQQAHRKREIEKLKQAELSEQTGRAFGGVLRYPTAAQMPTAAAAGGDRFYDAAASAYGGARAGSANSALPAHLTEEMALREHIQRRMLEEQAIKQHHQQQQQHQHHHQHHQQQAAMNGHHAMMGFAGGRGDAAAAAADREHLTRLLQLQQMSDEDLIRRAAEVQNAQSAALHESLERNKNVALEQQLLEARLLRSGLQRFQGARSDDPRTGLDMIDQAYADAAVARGFSAGSEKPASQTSPAQQVGIPQHSSSPNDPKPLRYFNNGIEVDMDGNPLQTNSPSNINNNINSTGPVQGNRDNAPSPSNNNLASLDNNIIAKFLTVVVSRVPEIAPAVADLLPDGGDPMLLKREFPNVVDATLAELKSIQERFSKAADNGSFDLHTRVTNCIAAIEPYKVDLSTAGGMIPLPGAASPAMTAGMMRQALPESGMHPNSCQPLMPNNPMQFHAAPAAVPRPQYFPAPEDLAMARQASAFKSNAAESQFTPLVNKENEMKPESPSEDLPMMAAYKSKKEAAKKAKQKKASKPKKNRKPRLVHHALFRGALDLNAVMRNTALAKREAALSKIERTQLNSLSKSNSSTESSSRQGIKPGSSVAEASQKSRPVKKRRISDQAEVDDMNYSTNPISNVFGKNVVKKNNRGPYCELLDQPLGASSKSSSKSKPSVDAGAKKENARHESTDAVYEVLPTSREEIPKPSNEDATNSVVTEESEDHAADQASQPNNTDDGDDGHFSAANVLLGLMGK